MRNKRFPSAHDENKKTFDTCGQTHVGIRDTQYALWLSSGIHDGHGLTHSTTRFRIRNLDSNGTGQAGRHLD